MNLYFAAVFCVVGMTLGQLLFKAGADLLTHAASPFQTKALVVLSVAVCLYGLTTLGWIWILQRVELGRIYPFMALAFVLVPVASHFVFGERLTFAQLVGSTLILIGIAVSAQR